MAAAGIAVAGGTPSRVCEQAFCPVALPLFWPRLGQPSPVVSPCALTEASGCLMLVQLRTLSCLCTHRPACVQHRLSPAAQRWAGARARWSAPSVADAARTDSLCAAVLFQLSAPGSGGAAHTFVKPWFTTWESALACWVRPFLKRQQTGGATVQVLVRRACSPSDLVLGTSGP